MLGADVLVIEPFGFFRAVCEHALALVAERQVDRGRNLFAGGGMAFNLFPDGIHGGMGAQETIGQLFIFAQQSQQQMLRFDVGAAELAGLIPREEDDSPGLFRVSLKHIKVLLSLRGHCWLKTEPRRNDAATSIIAY